jgi:hypothetical protein
VKVIYIASPYTKGDVAKNVRSQIDTADRLAMLGFLPRWPLASHFWHMIHPHDYQFWIDLDMQEIPRCDALLRLSGESAGADREVQRAIDFDIPVFYSIDDLLNRIGQPNIRLHMDERDSAG